MQFEELMEKLEELGDEFEEAGIPACFLTGEPGTDATHIIHCNVKGLATDNYTPVIQKFSEALNSHFKGEINQ